MADINPFCEDLEKTFGQRKAERVLHWLQTWKIPVPEDKKEYVHLDGEDGFLLFMHDFGCVLKIENAENYGDHLNHPLVLQPIGFDQVDDIRIEINPGILTGAGYTECETLSDDLEKDRITFWDVKPANIGFLPVKSEEHPRGIPVVLDSTAVKAKRDYKPYEGEHIQDRLYGHLREAFQNVLRSPLPQKENVERFWQDMAAAKEEKTLIPGWQLKKMGKINRPYLRKWQQAKIAGKAYRKRLKGHHSP